MQLHTKFYPNHPCSLAMKIITSRQTGKQTGWICYTTPSPPIKRGCNQTQLPLLALAADSSSTSLVSSSSSVRTASLLLAVNHIMHVLHIVSGTSSLHNVHANHITISPHIACSPAAALASSPPMSSVQAGSASVQSAAWASSTVLDGRLFTPTLLWIFTCRLSEQYSMEDHNSPDVAFRH